jgi:hypothetical protein
LEEIKQRAEEFGNEMKNRSGGIRKDISSMSGPRNGIGHAIGFFSKHSFFSSLRSSLLPWQWPDRTDLFGGIFLPLKGYFIQGFWQNIMAWAVLLFFWYYRYGLLTWLILPYHWREKRQ